MALKFDEFEADGYSHVPGKRKKDEWRQCASKVRYNTEPEAAGMARKVRDRRSTCLRAYECPFCNGFHLTKRV